MSIIEAGGMDVPAKKMWVPVTEGTSITTRGRFPVCSLTAYADTAHMSFWVPPDFHKIEQVYVVVISAVTATVSNWAVQTHYGAASEAYNTHALAGYVPSTAVTTNTIYNLGFATLLAGLAVNDYVGVEFILVDADEDVDVVGLRFEYD